MPAKRTAPVMPPKATKFVGGRSTTIEILFDEKNVDPATFDADSKEQLGRLDHALRELHGELGGGAFGMSRHTQSIGVEVQKDAPGAATTLLALERLIGEHGISVGVGRAP